ncbi:uncharacterized protein LOC120936213 [Rana temporaria]|uniref:uncharacterized protein LOC120936213 n=1 Tax=Rana temporaria TaxID=8407 RepID=UPI001AACF3ED|nr:uncharacterized protein LOC120936213 [Rana temporaria]
MEFLHLGALCWMISIIATQNSGTNLALRGQAAQSSSYSAINEAIKSIDGNTDSNFYKSCSCTQPDLSPWWRVDLRAPYRISSVVITNRGDCCGERLNGANILIGNSVENNGNNNPRCAEITNIPNGATQTFQCNGMVGQYVNIVLLGKREYLQLCEVQVFGEPALTSTPGTNLALQGQAAQSSSYSAINEAIKSIDGNTDSNFYKSCSCTQPDLSPWWRVDLRAPYRISSVVITNRGDCCGERLNGANILIGNSVENNGNNNPRCAEITNIPNGATQTFQCNGMVGQYVNIVLLGKREYLQLCEVQVFGEPALTSTPGTNLALQGQAAQSSSYSAINEAIKSIDGNTDSNFYKSCSCTQPDLSPWWRVDLRAPYRISSVVITNRGDCCGERLNGANILIGNSVENNGNNNPRCAEITNIPNGATQTFQCNGMVGQYVNIVLLGKREYLQLCEVQVFGEPALTSTPGTNLALQGQAAQSSSYSAINEAIKSIDGNTDSNFYKSCSCTQPDLSPWWRVDLRAPYRISSVVITNRGDCCGERLNGANILIGNSVENNGNNNPRCAEITNIPNGATQTFQCNGMVGQYVNIVLLGKREYLQLCEVQVFGEPALTSTPGTQGSGTAANSGDNHEEKDAKRWLENAG